MYLHDGYAKKKIHVPQIEPMSLLWWFSVFDVETAAQSVSDALSAIQRHPELINVQNGSGWTALRLVTSVWSLEDALVLVPALLQAGARSSIAAHKGDIAPVHAAAREGKLQILRLFLANDRTCAELATSEGLRPIHYACGYRHMDIVTFLVDQRVDVHARTHDGNNCLHYCGALSWKQGFDFMDLQGVDGHVRNDRGFTAWGKLYRDEIQAAAGLLRQQRQHVLSPIDAIRVLQLKPNGSEQELLDEMTEQRREEWEQQHIVFAEAFRSFRAGNSGRSPQPRPQHAGPEQADPEFRTETRTF
jgi:hypothetical protein